jgi:hypothetical protein
MASAGDFEKTVKESMNDLGGRRRGLEPGRVALARILAAAPVKASRPPAAPPAVGKRAGNSCSGKFQNTPRVQP